MRNHFNVTPLFLLCLDLLQGFGRTLAYMHIIVLEQFREGRDRRLCLRTYPSQGISSGTPSPSVSCP